jgi:hypothetical protein
LVIFALQKDVIYYSIDELEGHESEEESVVDSGEGSDMDDDNTTNPSPDSRVTSPGLDDFLPSHHR